MSLDLTTLRLMKYRARYERLARSVPLRALDPKIQIIFSDFGDFFREFPDVQVIEPGPFMLWFKGFKHPSLKDEACAVFDQLMREVVQDVPKELEQGLMARLVAAATAYDVADMIAKFNEGQEIDLRSTLNAAVTEFDKLVDRKVKSPQVLDPIEDLLHAEQNDVGLHWRLPCLNQHIKPLQAGDFVIVAARPDRGKTTFCSSELTYMASQVDALYPGEKRSILWFNNEGPGRKIVMRNFQSALNATTEDLVRLSNTPASKGFEHYKTKVREDYAAALGGRPGVLRVMDIHDMWNHEVEDVMREFTPALVVFDMIDNIKFGGAAANNGQRTDQLLEAMYQWARLMGVKHDCAVIACSQISADGDGMQWPGLSMLKDSKCFAPGTLVRMHSGEIRPIESIRVGEAVMGLDGTPRKVIGTGEGEEEMFRVSGSGWHFDCNLSHNLTVTNTKRKTLAGVKTGELVRMPLTTYLTGKTTRLLSAVTARLPYSHKDLPMDPYLFGLWLGDGAQRECRVTSGDSAVIAYLEGLPTYRRTYKQRSSCVDVYFGPREWLKRMGVWMNKHIPAEYKRASIPQRQALLAGLMDSDGTIDHGSSVIAMSNNRATLVDDIAEVARSLGYRTTTRHKAANNSYSVTFLPTDALPCLLPRKVHKGVAKGDMMQVRPLGRGRYVGITVDTDSRYVLANGVVVENTGKQGAADVIITLGAVNDPTLAKSRYIGTTKNKKARTGVAGSPMKEVMIDSDRGRYVEFNA